MPVRGSCHESRHGRLPTPGGCGSESGLEAMTTPAAAQATRMYTEAEEASAAIARQLADNAGAVEALAARLRLAPPRFIVTCARGSSDHAATFAKYLFETQLGLVTASAA